MSDLLSATKSIVEQFKSLSTNSVCVLHHNDADGLSAGAILLKSLERANISARSFCLEKPYPKVIKTLFEDEPEGAFILADFGSGMLSTLAELRSERSNVFVIDHHQLESEAPEDIHVLNARSCGGDSLYASASSLCFLFAEEFGSFNSDLLPLGLLGAFGDRLFDSDGRLCGLNKDLLARAVGNNLANDNEGYFIDLQGMKRVTELVKQVNALGSFGYFEGGPDVAIKGLFEGFGPEYSAAASGYQNNFEALLGQFISNTKIESDGEFQWFSLDESFSGMGVKTVGLVCEELIQRKLVDTEKYLVGFQEVPNEIPGIGTIEINQIKISMRLPSEVQKLVSEGSKMDLTELLPEATRQIGGFVDACHPHAAAVTISPGEEQKLLAALRSVAS